VEENSENFVAIPTPQTRNFHWTSILSLAFVLSFLATLFGSVAVSGFMFFVTLITGVGTLVSRINNSVTNAQSKGPIAKTFTFIGALFLVVVIVIVILFAGLVSSVKAHPIEGD
jgi:hypothetical protein